MYTLPVWMFTVYTLPVWMACEGDLDLRSSVSAPALEPSYLG